MEYRYVTLNDILLKISGTFVGALTDVKYVIDYRYNSITGPDTSSPEYDITITYRPMVGTRRLSLYNKEGIAIEINDPWQTITFSNCTTRTLTNSVDSGGMLETVRFTASSVSFR